MTTRKNTALEALSQLNIDVRNHLLPFYWQHGDHHDKIVEQIQRIQDSGAGALCVESRPHPDFCGETWWKDMDLIMAEAQRRSMEVWVLDDNHFPTGNANGLIQQKYPDLRAWRIIERHVDVLGPEQELALIVDPDDQDNKLLAAFAYKREQHDETLVDAPIDLTQNIHGNYLYWNVPTGCHRVFFFYLTRNGAIGRQQFYIDMLNKTSVNVLIEAVYEPHFQHYGHLFGTTFRGFFSDEPCLGNAWGGKFVSTDYGMYNRRPGMPGLALPWGSSVAAQLEQTFGTQWKSRLAALWYPLGTAAPLVRYTYMDAVSKGYRDNFVHTLGNWCRDHNVEYIGHVIEDQNAHARTGHGTAHYFRSQDGQDMSGMDVVLHQVMPGLGNYIYSASCSGGKADPDFFQFTLPKMCSSAAHLDQRTKGRAMCEVFGAFGWAEGGPFMKWLMDFLLVRGINEFVPHAFSPCFPDRDCPPHFGAEGHDPQFGAFTQLMGYTNQIASILAGANHVASVALLYHAESEWLSLDENERMLMQEPARRLMQAHIDFDIVPIDAMMAKATVEDGTLQIAGERYQRLIIPGSARLPETFIAKLNELTAQGLKVICVEQAPPQLTGCVQMTTLDNLGNTLRSQGVFDVEFAGNAQEVRHYHVRRNGYDIFYIVNEALKQDAWIQFNSPYRGKYLYLDIAQGNAYAGDTPVGNVPLSLAGGESCILVFGVDDVSNYPERHLPAAGMEIETTFSLQLASHENLDEFTPYPNDGKLINVNGYDHKPDFSGLMKYNFNLNIAKNGHYELDLGEVGQVAKLTVNGIDLGWRCGKPFRFDLNNILQKGDNECEVIVANTLVNVVKDHFSHFMEIPRSGLFGPLKLIAR